MIKKLLFLFIFMPMICLCGCVLDNVLTSKPYPAPIMMPGTTAEMQTPGFWISQSQSPDKILLSQEEITKFNESITNKLKTRVDVLTASPFFSKWAIINGFDKTLDEYASKKLYFANKKRPKRVFFYKIGGNINVSEILYDGVNQYGLTVKTTELRALPIKQGLYKDYRNQEIDELLKYTLDIGTPLIIQHISFDKKWYFVVSAYSSGWVESDKVVLCSMDILKEYLTKTPFTIITSCRAELFLDQEMTKFYGYATMGAKFPAGQKSTPTAAHVLAPYKDRQDQLVYIDLFMKSKCAHIGYLEYTPRNIINQAFEFLNQPYGWGGIYSLTDNNMFVEKVFSTAGVFLPLNFSSSTVFGAATEVFSANTSKENRIAITAKNAAAGSSLLFTKTNFYIYLGSYKDKPYAIHNIWQYEENIKKNKNRKILIKRTIVTDLLFQNKTKNKSFIENIISVRSVKS